MGRPSCFDCWLSYQLSPHPAQTSPGPRLPLWKLESMVPEGCSGSDIGDSGEESFHWPFSWHRLPKALGARSPLPGVWNHSSAPAALCGQMLACTFLLCRMKAGSLLDLHPQGCDQRLGMKFYRRGHAQGHASRDTFRSISQKVEIVLNVLLLNLFKNRLVVCSEIFSNF